MVIILAYKQFLYSFLCEITVVMTERELLMTSTECIYLLSSAVVAAASQTVE